MILQATNISDLTGHGRGATHSGMQANSVPIHSRTARVNNLDIHYLEAGQGTPLVLLHGWPTSSFLWRNIMPELAAHNRVIAPDLPGFGRSSKPLDVAYTFRFYQGVLDGLLQALDVDRTGLVVHDLGGPVGLFWATGNPDRITRLGILNTLVYPEMSWAVKLFMASLILPGVRELLVSQWGLRMAMRIGIRNKERLTQECLEGVSAPFVDAASRTALIKTATSLAPKGFALIAGRLKNIRCPVRVVYGAEDRILPDMARTAARLKVDLPQAEVTVIENCGHFLQEDRPKEVAELLAQFFSAKVGQ